MLTACSRNVYNVERVYTTLNIIISCLRYVRLCDRTKCVHFFRLFHFSFDRIAIRIGCVLLNSLELLITSWYLLFGNAQHACEKRAHTHTDVLMPTFACVAYGIRIPVILVYKPISNYQSVKCCNELNVFRMRLNVLRTHGLQVINLICILLLLLLSRAQAPSLSRRIRWKTTIIKAVAVPTTATIMTTATKISNNLGFEERLRKTQYQTLGPGLRTYGLTNILLDSGTLNENIKTRNYRLLLHWTSFGAKPKTDGLAREQLIFPTSSLDKDVIELSEISRIHRLCILFQIVKYCDEYKKQLINYFPVKGTVKIENLM